MVNIVKIHGSGVRMQGAEAFRLWEVGNAKICETATHLQDNEQGLIFAARNRGARVIP